LALVELNEAFACQVLAVLKGWAGTIMSASMSRLGNFIGVSDCGHRRAHLATLLYD